MKKIRFMIFVMMFMFVFTACDVKEENDAALSINKETFDQLVKESENEDLKDEVLKYIKSDNSYVEMGDVEKDGVIYKSVQMNLNEEWDSLYRNLKDYLLETEGIKEELEKELTNLIAESPHHSSTIKRKMSARVMTGLNEDMGKVISFERGEDFNLFKEWIVTALLKYDESGKIVDVIVFDGAVGNSLNIKDDKIAWEVCIADKVDFYYWGLNAEHEPEIDGIGKMSGTVYSMIVNDEHNIDNITFVRNTKNNDFNSVCSDIGYARPDVKNYELTISDFINSEELKKLITTNPSDFKNQIRKLYGMEHEEGVYVQKSEFEGWYKQDAMYYFTADGYLINITTVPHWTKISIEDAYKINVEEWEDMTSELMFVGELNHEFGDVSIEMNKEGDITNVDTLVSEDKEKELKEYLDKIGYNIYDIKIQYAMEYNGKKYICVHKDLWRDIDFPNYSSLWDYTAYEERFEVRKVELEDKDIMTDYQYKDYLDYIDRHSFIRRKDELGYLITHERDSGEYIAEGWAVTKLIIIDESDKIVGEREYTGTITTGLGVRDGHVEWEVFISNRTDYYAIKCEGEESLSGHGYTAGNVYKLILDERDLVDKKELVRESYDNDYDSLCIKEDYSDYYSEKRNVYVKNQELTIKDFIENEDVVNVTSSWNLPYYGKTLLGASHVYRNVYDGPQIYFTTDGYAIYVDIYVKYAKMSKDEFIEKYSIRDDYSWKGEFKDMMYELRVNEKLAEG